jgi:hypothetical protein
MDSGGASSVDEGLLALLKEKKGKGRVEMIRVAERKPKLMPVAELAEKVKTGERVELDCGATVKVVRLNYQVALVTVEHENGLVGTEAVRGGETLGDLDRLEIMVKVSNLPMLKRLIGVVGKEWEGMSEV